MIYKTDTIFAQSTARGKAGVSMIRISGIEAKEILLKITKLVDIEPNYLYFSKIYRSDGYVVDKAMVVYFAAPHSFTGEDVVELHLHGSIAIVKMIYNILFEYGIRLAAPGEFSKRAFYSGKMDLTSAEGLADLIDSETEMQHMQAMKHLSGEFEDLCNNLRTLILRSMSLLEAYIDFPDEGIPDHIIYDIEKQISDLIRILQSKLSDARRGERLRNGVTMVVIGEPNVGKSSLMNFLSQRDVAIISDIAGTTRDVIESHIDIGGYPIIVSDTAGLRDNSHDIIEMEGVKRAQYLAKSVDIKILVLSVDNLAPKYNIDDLIDENTIIVINKIDKDPHFVSEYKDAILMSIHNKIGLDFLLSRVKSLCETLVSNGDSVDLVRERHRIYFSDALDALESVDLTDIVFASENLRIAYNSLSMLTGTIEIEEILGEIFKNFCIGK